MLADLAPAALVGSPSPRIGPPLPLLHDLAGYRKHSADLDIVPMPWQENSACYLTAVDARGRFLFRDVGIVVGRQNGRASCRERV